MDSILLSVTFILIVFLFISYFLNVLKLSTPLILIYLIFCFTYIIDSDSTRDAPSKVNKLKDSDNGKNAFEIVETPDIKSKKVSKMNDKISDISKPVVSFNPKPIIIDTNLILQNDKQKTISNNSKLIEKAPRVIEEDKDENTNYLKLNEVMICRGVYKRNPIKPGFKFSNDVDSLFCYTKISNKGSKQEIKHLWYYENKLITAVTYNIKTSYNYRSWSKKTILPSQIGEWRVDVIDNKERVLGSRKFQISALNDVF